MIILGIVILIIAIACGVYACFAAQKRGPILSNSYLWLDKEARKLADTEAEYKLVTVIFGCLAAVFALISLFIFTKWKLLYLPIAALIIFIVVYAVIDSIKNEKNK